MDGKAFILCVKLLNFYGRAICHIFLSVRREYSLLVEINDDMRRGKEWERGQRRRGKLLKWLKRNLEWNREIGERSPIREEFSSKNDQRNKFRSNLKPSLDILLSTFIITFKSDEFQGFILINSKENQQLVRALENCEEQLRNFQELYSVSRIILGEKRVFQLDEIARSSAKRRHKIEENVVFFLLLIM